MLTLKNKMKIAVMSIALVAVLFAGTAFAKSEKAAARQQARVEQRQAKQQVRAEQNAVKQAARQEKQQVRVERRQVKQAVRTEQRAVKQVQRQENRAERIELRNDKQEQRAEARAEKLTNNNRTVNRDINVERIVTPDGTKVVRERNYERTVTRNGNTFTRNVNRKFVRDNTNRFVRDDTDRFTRPGVFREHNKNGESAHVKKWYPGRKSGVYKHIVWRGYGYPVFYRHRHNVFAHYVRPSYHRKYVFVSLGYWPSYCSSVRYYWYGFHPYTWYGSYPVAYETGDTYNYYTYNNYNYDTDTGGYTSSEYSPPLQGVDETTFEDVRQKLEEHKQQEPDEQTTADTLFEDGVTAFEQEDYTAAAKAFADAIALEPDDLVLPFAYTQALFATEQYSKAADTLRAALIVMPAEEQGLYFPRGLYSDDEILFEQIERLQSRAATFAYDPDMTLLLGYQLLGAEQYDQARLQLENAAQYNLNSEAAAILINLLDKVEGQNEQGNI